MSEKKLGWGVEHMGTVKKFPDWSVAFFVCTEELGTAGGGQRGRTGIE